MRGYLEPQEYYEDSTRADWIHIDDLQDSFDKMKENLENILDVLYGDADVEDIEIDVEALCKQLGTKFPSKALKIAKSQEITDRIEKIRKALLGIIEKDNAKI